jgi:multidrug efflux pump subunit AcrA (membrane-fusion protein)
VQQEITGTTAQFSMQQPPPLINLAGLTDDNSTSATASTSGRRRGRWIIIIVAVLLVILLGAFFFTQCSRGAGATYQSGKVTQGNLVLTVNATGPLQSANYNLVFSGSGGKIEEINVTVGQQVKKDQVLAKLDKTLLQDAVNQAGIAVGNAQASLNAAIAASDSSSNQSSANVSAAQTAVANAQANLKQTQAQGDANVDVAQTALDNARANLSQVRHTADLQKQSALDTYNATGCNSAAPTPTPIPTATPTATTNCAVALSNYKVSVNQADANVAAAQAQVDTAQAALNQAQASANTNNTSAQNQVNTAKSQVNTTGAGVNVSQTSAQSQVTTAQSQLNTALGQLVQAQHNLDNATLKAPHDGIVTQINGTVGGAPGSPSSTSTASTPTGASLGGTFIQIVDPSGLQVLANLNEADIANVQVGETVSFTVNAYGSQRFTGIVSIVPPFGQTISNVVTYPVTIDVDQSSLKGAHLLPSMTANVTINTVQHNGVLLMPVNAVNFARLVSSGNSAGGTQQLVSPQAANKALNQARQMLARLEVANPNLVSEGPIPAFVIEKSGQQFVAKPVVLGLTDGTVYEILQGLSLGETFLVGTRG